MGKDLVVGMSATFVIWVGVLAWSSSRLVHLNWALYRAWPEQVRDTRVKMALWLAVPLLSIGLLWMRSVALVGFLRGYWLSTFGIAQMIVYLPVILLALALALWWVFDRTYGPVRADRLWCHLMWIGVAAGAAVTLFSRMH